MKEMQMLPRLHRFTGYELFKDFKHLNREVSHTKSACPFA